MKIDMTSKDDLNGTILVTLEKSDYESQFLNEIKHKAKSTDIKGFRKGKSPVSMIRKLYGKSILAKVIDDKIKNILDEYIATNKIKILGTLLPSENVEFNNTFNPATLKQFNFSFDLGIAPEIDVKGISKDDQYVHYEVSIENQDIEDELLLLRKKFGTQEEVDDQVLENDILQINAHEIENGKPKKEGWSTEFNIIVSTIVQKYKDELLKLKLGDEFDFLASEIEENKNDGYIDKYILNIDSNKLDRDRKDIGNEYKGKISKIKRLNHAEFNEDFFIKAFGDEKITSEDAARDLVRKNVENEYNQKSLAIVHLNLKDNILSTTQFDLPKEFLKRLMKYNEEGKTEEDIERDFPKFIQNLRWSLIMNKLEEEFEIEVSQEEVQSELNIKINQIMKMYGLPDDYSNLVREKMLGNQEEIVNIYNQLKTTKIFENLVSNIKLNKEKIDKKDFEKKIEELKIKQN